MNEMERRILRLETYRQSPIKKSLSDEELEALFERTFLLPEGYQKPPPPTDEERERIREYIRSLNLSTDGEE